MGINKEWHAKNRMPKNPTMYQKAEWHIRHQKNCGCGEIPESVLDYIKKGRKMPK